MYKELLERTIGSVIREAFYKAGFYFVRIDRGSLRIDDDGMFARLNIYAISPDGKSGREITVHVTLPGMCSGAVKIYYVYDRNTGNDAGSAKEALKFFQAA